MKDKGLETDDLPLTIPFDAHTHTHTHTHIFVCHDSPKNQNVLQHLVTPIMDAGGRMAMYELMGMEPPEIKSTIQPQSDFKLVIDKTGETDEARYKGLKMMQVIDDDTFGAQLAESIRKSKEGKEMRPKIIEEGFDLPFSGKTTTKD